MLPSQLEAADLLPWPPYSRFSSWTKTVPTRSVTRTRMDLFAWRIAMPPDSSSDDTVTSTSMAKPKKSVRYFNTYLSLLLYQFFILVDWCLHFNLCTCRLRIWKPGQWIGWSSSERLFDPSYFNRHVLPRHPSQFNSSTNCQRLQQQRRRH